MKPARPRWTFPPARRRIMTGQEQIWPDGWQILGPDVMICFLVLK